jgi:hypothetical protein
MALYTRDGSASNPRHWKPGSLCIICGEKIFPYQRFNFDHLIPMSRGGPRGRSNKYLSHLICNMVKGDRWPFWLRTNSERLAVRKHVKPKTWEALQRAWKGHPD